MGVVSETKHLAEGSDFPPTTPGLLRLYAMRFCPFTQRTKLALAHKGIPFEIVNVNLKSKPNWFLQRNPLGSAPTLELDGKVICESAICNEWLDDAYPQKKLGPTDPYKKAQWKMLAERFGKIPSAFYKTLFAKSEEEKSQSINDLRVQLTVFEEALPAPFFGGNDVASADYHFWPWFERLTQLRTLGFELTSDAFPRLHDWVDRMQQQPAVKATHVDEKLQDAFHQSSQTGVPDYDIEI